MTATLLRRRGLEDPEGESAVRSPRELGRAQDGGTERNIGCLFIFSQFDIVLSQGLADPPGIEESRAASFAVTERTEPEDLRPLDKERTLFRIERLDGGEIEYCGVRLNLSEIGVDRRIEDQAVGDADLHVHAAISGELGDAVVTFRGGDPLLACKAEGHHLDAARAGKAVQSHQVSEPGHEPVRTERGIRPAIGFLLAVDEPCEVDPPDLSVGINLGGSVPEDAEGDPDFR